MGLKNHRFTNFKIIRWRLLFKPQNNNKVVFRDKI